MFDYWPFLVIILCVWWGFHVLHREMDRRFSEIEKRLDVIFNRQRLG
jgi:hypothetical protein